MPRLPSQLTYNDLNGEEAKAALIDWFNQLLSSQPYLQKHLTLPMARISLSVNVGIDMHIGGTVPVSSPPEHLDISGSVQMTNLTAEINAAPIPGGRPPDAVREQHGIPVPRPGYGPRETGSHLFLSDVVEQSQRRGLPLGVEQTALAPEDQHKGQRQDRQGIVADGYVFSQEKGLSPSDYVCSGDRLAQSIPIDRGEVSIDLTGQGRMRMGSIEVKADSHTASKKKFGDQGGDRYGTVSSTLDAGPAGLSRPGHAGGLYRDGRSKLLFGNTNRG